MEPGVNARETNKTTYSVAGTMKSNIVQTCLLVLILTATAGTLKLVFFSDRFEPKSSPFGSYSALFQSHFLDIFIQNEFLALENNDLAVNGAKKSHAQPSIVETGFLTSPTPNSRWKIFFLSIDSSPYPPFFALLPLRSPPLFS